MELNELKRLFDEELYDSVIEITKDSKDYILQLFYAASILEKNKVQESKAITAINDSLKTEVSLWGLFLLQNLYQEKQLYKKALEYNWLAYELDRNNPFARINLLHCMVFSDQFSEAINLQTTFLQEQGLAFTGSDDEGDGSTTIIIQCFKKTYSLQKTLQSLIKIEGAKRYNILLFQDYKISNWPEEEYKKWISVRDICKEFQNRNRDKFKSIHYECAQKHLGTSLGCVVAINTAFEKLKSKNVCFFEDDVLISRNISKWILFSENKIDSKTPFSATESIFFNNYKQKSLDEKIDSLKIISAMLDLDYDFVSFVPSTSFITNSSQWKKYWALRSMSRGPDCLNKYFIYKRMGTLFPIVPRAIDLGMLDADGHSMAQSKNKALTNIEEKYFYLSSITQGDNFKPSLISQNLLLLATCEIDDGSINSLKKELNI